MLWYCENVANITVTVPDDVYRAARIHAAERGSSVSALVSEFLRSLSEHDAEFSRLERRQHEVQARIGTFRAADRLSRSDIHDRAVR
jgi:plasmid stability protein